MKNSFARSCVLFLLRLYPHAWRERYADEVMVLLEESPPSLQTVFDLLLGMVDAHLNADLFTARVVVLRQRLRFSHFAIYCCSVFFYCLFMLYITQVFYLSDSWYFYQHAYSPTWWLLNNWILLNYLAVSLLLFTFIVSLISIATSLKQVLTGGSRAVFFAWGFLSIVCIIAFSYVVLQIIIPRGDASGMPKALTYLLMRLFDVSTTLSWFGTQISIALVFAALYETLKKWREKQYGSATWWTLVTCIPLAFLVTIYRFALTTYSFAVNPPATYVQTMLIVETLLGLLVFGWCFVSAKLDKRRKKETSQAVRASYLSFLPFVIITLFMNVLAIFILSLTIGISIDIPNIGPRHIFFFNSLTLFMIVLACYTSISLWRNFLAQHELHSLGAFSHEDEGIQHREQHSGQMMRK